MPLPLNSGVKGKIGHTWHSRLKDKMKIIIDDETVTADLFYILLKLCILFTTSKRFMSRYHHGKIGTS